MELLSVFSPCVLAFGASVEPCGRLIRGPGLPEMPVSSDIAAFRAHHIVVYGHGIKVLEYGNFVEILFQLGSGLGIFGAINRLIESASRA